MTFEHRPLRRQKLRYSSDNADNPLRFQLVLDGEKQTPDEAPTVTIYRPGSATALVTDAAMTLAGTVATYAVDTTTVASWPVEQGYRARVTTAVSGVDYVADIYVDVVKHLLRLDVGIDQLEALDERIVAMQHRSDDDFSDLIEAVRDELQARIESKVIEDKKLLENMILDVSRVSIPARYLILARVFEEKSDYEAADRYKSTFDELWRATMSSIQYDVNQDQVEGSTIGGVQSFRLVY